MNIDDRQNEIDADLIRSLRESEDLAPETPEEVEALLKKMKEKGIPIGTTQAEAAQLAGAASSGSKIISFPRPVEEPELEVELARAARCGKSAISKEIEERMKRDRESAERKASNAEEGKA